MLYFIASRYGSEQEYFHGLLGFVRFKVIFMAPIAATISAIYYTSFYTCYGASPGKMFLGLRIVDYYSGENLGIMQTLVRESFGKWLSALFFGLGFILPLLRADGRALHDLFVSSQVIREN